MKEPKWREKTENTNNSRVKNSRPQKKQKQIVLNKNKLFFFYMQSARLDNIACNLNLSLRVLKLTKTIKQFLERGGNLQS